ncbi:MAG TPA: tetratricopeptide repeat protein [Gammaproteobacteria bacterium]|nr:tetratricopeptide repeat protein [Gammaproteobacteria bacterium]
MSGGALAAFVILAGLWPPWPFGRGHSDEPRTVEDLGSKAVEVDTSARVDDSEQKAIESYRTFLDLSSPDAALRAEAMRRLADLELETGEAEELERNVESIGGGFGDAVELYRQLLDTYPDYAKNDLVLYQLARAYEADGRTEEALATLDRLVKEFPKTPYFDEAEFRRGETLFVQKRYEEAEQAYAKVLESGSDSQFYEQALYKHGWSLFKQLRNEESLESFFALLDRKLGTDPAADPAKTYAGFGRADQELIDDTLRVVSIGFSYMTGPKSIVEWFAAHGDRPYAYVVYSKLGDLYLEKERYQDAADAYRAFAAASPDHAKAPLLQVEAIKAYEKGGFPDLVLEGKRDFVERYAAGSAYWQRYTFADQPEVAAELKSNLSDLATYHHALAQKSKDAAEYAEAARWYREYLKSFPDDEAAAEKNFLLAEVLFESGDFRNAAVEYERTAYAYPPGAKSAESGYAALLAYQRYEERLPEGPERVAWHRQSIDSALRFAATYPEHEQAAAVQTDAADKLFKLGEYAAARDAAMKVVQLERPPPAALDRTAWTVVAHSDFELQDFAAAEGAYTRLISLIPADDKEHGEIVERIASSIYKQGEQAEKQGDDAAAVEHFLRVAQAAPTSSIRPTAEYDAAAALIRLQDWPRAAAVLEGFKREFPSSDLMDDVTAKLAVAYVQSGDKTRAASEFERVADGGGSADEKKDALWRAADLYAESGQDASASTAFAKYVERYPSPAAQAMEARQRLVDLAAKTGDAAAKTRWLSAIVAADAAAGGERTDRTKYLAAKAQLELAAPARDAFLGVRLVAPLEKSLKVKQQRMEQALADYGKAADYGVAEVTTAATYEIAELYHGLARALNESERPKNLSADELEQYNLLLDEQSYPFEEKSIEVHEVNAARTADGVYDEWVRKSLAALAELVPARYAKNEIGESFVSAIE